MKTSTKKWLGFFSWVPLAIFIASFVYFAYVTLPLIENKQYGQHEKLVYYLSTYYSEMFAWFFVGSVVGLIVLLIFCVHLLRLKNMHPATKALWIIFMSFTGSFALPLFYYFELKREPENVPMHASIE